jgi:hypothetical protein
MLAFDIETMGLKKNTDAITIVSTEDFATGKTRSYEFARIMKDGCQQDYEREKNAMVQAFDAATSLCAFNGLKFDIPFMETQFDLDKTRIAAWAAKTTDIFAFCKHKYMHTFSLNAICQVNNIPVKIASGLAAIEWAKEGKFELLREYCEADVAILNKLYSKRYVCNPRNQAVMDLQDFVCEKLYPDSEHDVGSVHAINQAKLGFDTGIQDRVEQITKHENNTKPQMQNESVKLYSLSNPSTATTQRPCHQDKAFVHACDLEKSRQCSVSSATLQSSSTVQKVVRQRMDLLYCCVDDVDATHDSPYTSIA